MNLRPYTETQRTHIEEQTSSGETRAPAKKAGGKPKIDLRDKDLRGWFPTDPEMKRALAEELERRMAAARAAKEQRMEDIPEGGVKAEGSQQFREKLETDSEYTINDYLNDRSRAEYEGMHASERAYQTRKRHWASLPGYEVSTGRSGSVIYRGENLRYVPEKVEHVPIIWGMVARRNPALARAIAETPFPGALGDIANKVIEFHHEGRRLRAIIARDGRVFFAAPPGGPEPKVWRAQKSAPRREPDRFPFLKIEPGAPFKLDHVRRHYQGVRDRLAHAKDDRGVAELDGAYTRFLTSQLTYVLGLESAVDGDEIKRSYKRTMRSIHPDIHDRAEGGEERAKALNALFEEWDRAARARARLNEH